MRVAARVITPLYLSALGVVVACGGGSGSQVANGFGPSAGESDAGSDATAATGSNSGNTSNNNNGGSSGSNNNTNGNNANNGNGSSGGSTSDQCPSSCSVDSDCQGTCPAAASGESNCCMGGTCYMYTGPACPSNTDAGTNDQ